MPMHALIEPKAVVTELAGVLMPAHYDGSIRDESIMGYVLLRRLLRQHFDLELDSRRIQLSSAGKPYLPDSGIHFSISHSSDYVACVVGIQPVGIDIEQPRPFPARLVQRVLTAGDVATGIDPLTAWVIKEAYSKYRGLGLGLTFGDYSATELLQQHGSWLSVTEHYTCAAFSKKSAQPSEVM